MGTQVTQGQIADGAVATSKIADGALSADASGRAKMADGFVTAGKLGAGAVTGTALGSGTTVNRQYQSSNNRVTSNVAIPADNTIPQNTEGTELLTASITPRATTNRLRVRFNAYFHNNCGAQSALVVALFRDSTANAKKGLVETKADGHAAVITLEFEEEAGSTSATTYKIRFGPSSAAGSGWAANGGSTNNLLGGVDTATLIIEEVVP